MFQIEINSKIHGRKVILIDERDRDIVGKYCWHLRKGRNCFYAIHHFHKGGRILLHRLILGVSDPSIFVDHKDGDGLNNQRSNLRLATRSQNGANSKSRKNAMSEFKGVTIDRKRKNKWVAGIRKDGVLIQLGAFGSQIEAAQAYNAAAIRIHGEFARLNSIPL